MNDDDALVSLADLAEMASVSRPAVSNWRRRNPDFPSPVTETGATSLFRLGDLKRWMAKEGKRLDDRSVDQLIWSALNPARGTALPEEVAQAGMILLGYLALALRLDKTMASALRTAVAGNDQQALGNILARLGEHAGQLGLGELFPGRMINITPAANRMPLLTALDLALEHGVSEAFEALIAAVGRGSRGEGLHTTPSGVADLTMSLAAPVGGVLIDPACGHGTFLLAASEAAAEPLTLIGQDVNSDACRITRLRMFVQDRAADIIHGDTLRARTLLNPTMLVDDVEADLVIADPPFAMNWRPDLADTQRMPFGVPPSSRADLAWLQDGISRLKPSGLALFILGNGPTFRGGAEGEIRRRLIESRCIRAVVALPPALYPTTTITTSLWIVSKPRQPGQERPGGDRVLLIDASQLGNRRRSRTELTRADVATITDCFRAWQAHGELSAEGSVRAAAVPVGTLLSDGGNLNPARWIEDPADDPERRLERVAAAAHDLHEARAAFSQASFSLPPLAAGSAGPTRDRWAIRKATDLAVLIRPRRIDPDLIGTGPTPLIRAGDIGQELTVRPGSRVDPALVTGRVEVTQPGDVVVAPDGAKPRAAVDHLGGAVVSGPLQILRPRPGSIDPVVLAALITSIGPKYAAGTSIRHVDLGALELPCPDPRTASWLARTLETLDQQRREALAAVKAIDELKAELVSGLSSQAIRLESHAPREEGQ